MAQNATNYTARVWLIFRIYNMIFSFIDGDEDVVEEEEVDDEEVADEEEEEVE